jgi:syntaxin 16
VLQLDGVEHEVMDCWWCPGGVLQVRLQVQRQLAQALFKLSVEFRKEETRFLNKMEAQKGLAAGSSIGLIEDEAAGTAAAGDPGFTETQLMKVTQQ